MSPSDKFLDRVRQTIISERMIQKNDRILVGLSGGPDSVALTRVLIQLRKVYSLTIGTAHLNHDLRADESLRDEKFSRRFAENNGLPFFNHKQNVKDFASQNKLSIEEAGRKLRYRYLFQTAEQHGYSKIALGHNRDDTVELVLMNFLRGAGLKGLSGIPPCRDIIIRPLIHLPRTMILAYLEHENQDFVLDSSNKDPSFLRNKIRLELIPLLEKEYNPEISGSIFRITRLFRQESHFMELQAKAFLTDLIVEQSVEMVSVRLKGFVELHPAMKYQVARQCIQKVKSNLRRISFRHIEDVLGLAESGVQNKSLDLPDRIRVFIKNDLICFKKESVPLRELKRN